MQDSGSSLDLLSQNLYLSEIARQFLPAVGGRDHCFLASERQCTALLVLAYTVLVKHEADVFLPN